MWVGGRLFSKRLAIHREVYAALARLDKTL
jgi:hypothetical protein